MCALMKKITTKLSAVFLLICLSGCAVTLPIDTTDEPVGRRVGVSKATVFVGFVAFNQDASIRTAARNGGITQISTVDIKTKSFLGILTSYETIVTGE